MGRNSLPAVILMRGRRQRGNCFDHGGRVTEQPLPTSTCIDFAGPLRVHCAELLAVTTWLWPVKWNVAGFVEKEGGRNGVMRRRPKDVQRGRPEDKLGLG